MAGMHTMPKQTQREMKRERRRKARGGRRTLADRLRVTLSRWREPLVAALSEPDDEPPLTGAEAGLAAVKAIQDRYPDLPRLDWRYAGVNQKSGLEQVVGFIDPSMDYGRQRQLMTLYAAVLDAEQHSHITPDGHAELWATNRYGGVLVTVQAMVPADQPASALAADLTAEPPIPMVEVSDEVEPTPIEMEIEAAGGPPTEVFVVVDPDGVVVVETAGPEPLPDEHAVIAAECAREVAA